VHEFLLQENFSRLGINLAPGLSDEEIERIQERFDFIFPPDLKELLQFALPVNNGFVDWRSSSEREILDRMNWPFEGICFDIVHNGFWPHSWGKKPDRLDESIEVARSNVRKAPKLIPIFSHRYLPDIPSEAGNPIFSVYQTDIIIYGSDLRNYLEHEFGRESVHDNSKYVEFWSEIVGWNNAL
jgi:hypothetical protein